MKKRTYRLLCVLAGTVLLATGALTGCSGSGKSGVSKGDGIQQTEEAGATEKHAPKIDGLEYKKTMKLKYATGFDVYYYKEGYKLLDVHEDRQYLIVPEGKKKPADLDKEIVYDNMKLAAKEMEIGSVMIGLFDPAVITKEFILPEYLEPTALLFLGYPSKGFLDSERHAEERRPLCETVWYEAYAE